MPDPSSGFMHQEIPRCQSGQRRESVVACIQGVCSESFDGVSAVGCARSPGVQGMDKVFGLSRES